MADARIPTPIDDLAEQWLDTMLELTPELHVHLGRPGRESDYTDRSPDGVAAQADAARSMLARVRAARPEDQTDVVTQAELVRTLELELEQIEAGFWQRDLNVIASPGQDLRDVFDLMGTDTTDDWEHVAQRLHNLPSAMSGYLDSLRIGIAAGSVPAIRQVREVAAQARKQTGTDSFFAGLATRADVPAALQSRLDDGARAASEAYGRLVEFLERDLAPHAPEADALGREHYALASRAFVGAEIDLDETYEWGVEELARMVAEQERIADQVLPGAGVAEAIAHLDADPARKLHGTEALQAWMQQTSDRAVDELGRTHFDIPDEMRRLECMIAPTQEGGIYYTPPSEDFARAGRMWWSVPEGITEFDTWRELTTVYHEGVPGHHLQCGLAVWNSAELNGWRRLNWNSGHGEGWALYAERLMADLGYLDDPADRLGMLDGQRMRAARVVLDIGVHLQKPRPDGSGEVWTGDDAFGFMAQHVNMNDSFVRFEVNRYLGWAGQAPSYKVGQRMWEQLRDDWVSAQTGRPGGADLKEFHRQALAVGSIGLGTLRTTLLP
ncbi:DUF885 domain-containing protein [Aeromicrobium fastidiosum]|uniref:DUF885 domain-containing protein n=1 Tax=Aeromicrobium fastidiosum TaxID=52699 RepID=A0A641AQK5_9ACTN|nr:DUF885 domain-containing protein [Aeromicrobium fastidiosum]KAA1379962.1 DUF885 domain-containing protein [Aeromicrobium fastidiosum]MBP2389475.1 uncharacterized protein (DUF885 family) [Aeromicrobium fastidiosum]